MVGHINALGASVLELYLTDPHHDHRVASLGTMASQET